MASTDAPSLESLLHLCADSAPRPWRPAVFARTHGVDRDSLDEPLNRLRNAGLIKLTDWEAGVGQGYVLTKSGEAALNDRAALARHLSGKPQTQFDPAATPRARPDTYARGEAIRSAVFDHHRAPVTRALIAIQIVVFAIGLYFALRAKVPLEQYLTSGRSPIIEYLAVSPLHMARGEWWTLLTCALVHAGGIHLMLNLISHGALGPTAEGMYGSARFLAIWLISAIGGSIAVAIRGQAAVGSSGAVCGIIGAQAAFVAIYRAHLGRNLTSEFRTWLIKTAVILVLFSLMPRVSGSAHFGGLVAGALAGALLAVHRFGPASVRPLTILGTLAIPALGIGYLAQSGILHLSITAPQIAQKEVSDFTDRLLAPIQHVESASLDIEENVIDPLRAQRPEQRRPDLVQGAVIALGELRSEQLHVLDALAQTGRYQTQSVEKVRHAAEDLIRKRAEVTKQYEDCLRRGDRWTMEKDEYLLQFLLNQAVEAEIVYRRAAGRD
jgi:membrane associated rhomboid family serine protease